MSVKSSEKEIQLRDLLQFKVVLKLVKQQHSEKNK